MRSPARCRGLRAAIGPLAIGGLAFPAATAAQAPPAAVGTPPSERLSVDIGLPPTGFVSRDAPVLIRLDRELARGERIAVFFGSTDMTDLFRPMSGGFRYDPRLVPLPSGERDITVHLVSGDGEWRELATRPMRVRNALGLDRSSADPTLEIGVEGQLAEGHEPASAAPSRATYQDFTGLLGLRTDHGRAAAGLATEADVIGVSNRDRALRAATLGPDAPKIDLADYRVRLGLGSASITTGSVSLGRHTHLLDGFASRGAVIGLAPGSRVSLELGAANGTQVVGWSNVLGLDDPAHRIVSGSLGLELVERPGGLRIEVGGMDGSLQPLAGFNQGVVNDAEESRGVAVEVEGSDPTGRVRFGGGFTRSTYTAPDDPTLSQGTDLVPVREVTRNARHLQGSLDLIRGAALGGGRSVSFSVGYRHERVDPLFRSLGAFTSSDRRIDEWSAQADLAGIAVRGSHGRSRDNLDDIPSILTTRTRRTALDLFLPVATVAGTASSWLPTVAYRYGHTRQTGDGVPENGGFDPSHIPDQASVNHTVSADWSWSVVTLGYRFGRSRQDNRQPGREEADFTVLTHGVTLGARPAATLSLDLSFDLERSENEELGETGTTRRFGVRAGWVVYSGGTLSAAWSITRAGDEADTRRRSDSVLDAQWSAALPGMTALGAQYYVRFSRIVGSVFDRGFDLDGMTSTWSVQSGLNLSLF